MAAPIPEEVLRAQNPRITWLLRFVKPEHSVLDVGCANYPSFDARATDWLHGALGKRVRRLVGVEFMADAVAHLRARGYEVLQGDAERLHVGERFDLVVAGELIEHLKNPGAFLKSARRHLKPDGRLLLTTPNVLWWGNFVRAALKGAPSVGGDHTAWWDEITLRQLLAQVGFEVEVLGYVPPSRSARFWRLSRALCRLGPARLGADTLLAVCRPAPPRGPYDPPPPVLAEMRRYLDQDYARRVARGRSERYADETLTRLTQGQLAGRIRDSLAQIEFDLRGKRVLDLGAGLGEAAYHFPRLGAEVVAADVDREALRLGRAWADGSPGPARWVRAAGERLAFPGASFDLVILNHVLEHVARPQRVLDEALRVVRPGGWVYLCAPNYRIPYEHHYELWWVPALPRRWARRYLQLRGRDPRDFDRLNFVTREWLARRLRRPDVDEVVDLVELKLRRPAMIRSRARRVVAGIIGGLRLTKLAAAWSPSLEVIVRRRGGR